MRLARLALFLSLLVFQFSITPVAWANQCPDILGSAMQGDIPELSPDAQVGKLYRVRISWVRPTQFAVGYKEISSRKKLFEKKTKKEQLEYLLKKTGSVVIGSDGYVWLIDGHHLGSVLSRIEEETGKARYLYVRVLGNYLAEENVDMEKLLVQKSWCYLKDGNGKRRNFAELPETLQDLQNDSYRSLAWLVKENGGFHESSVPFAEFQWADFFRDHIKQSQLKDKPWKAFKKAMNLARSLDAKTLPGYKP